MNNQSSTSPKIQEVKWRDSRMYIHQERRDETWEVCVISSVGYVVEETKDYIVLAGDLVDEDVRRALVIPKENIVYGTRKK